MGNECQQVNTHSKNCTPESFWKRLVHPYAEQDAGIFIYHHDLLREYFKHKKWQEMLHFHDIIPHTIMFVLPYLLMADHYQLMWDLASLLPQQLVI